MPGNPLEIAARLGFAARGVMYMAIGYLALRLGQTAGNGGALAFLYGEGGRIVLAVIAIGFVGYGLWRLAEAALDGGGNGTDAKGIAKRAGGAVSGLIHLGLAVFCVRTLAGGESGGSGDAAEQGAQMALDVPGGATALMVAAGVLLVVGGYQLVKAVKLGFLRHLDASVASRPWIAWLGRIGYLARGTVFVLTAWFTWQAGSHSRAAAAGSTEQALDTLPETLRLLVAAGFVMFGIFSLVEARYRRIRDPGVEATVRRSLS